jgi:RNA polymerase sigma-70 factor (ECF subfamily)
MTESTSILQRVAAGDATAIDECLREYSGLVWSLARRLLRNLTDAEDAVQEVFIELWQNAGRFDPSVASEATFIATIARRRLIDRHRKLSRQVDQVSLPDESAMPGEEALDRVELDDEAARARRGLAQLRSEERHILELSIYEGLSQSQIATKIDLPLGTVKTHSRRGLKRLRQMLGAEQAET